VEGWRRVAEGVVEVAYGGSEGRDRNWRGLEEGLEGRAEEVEAEWRGGGGRRRVQFEDTS
jgi:hypothetical protein